MTIATLLVALIATTAADTSGDPVLLDFHASWCGPCRQMRPEVERLVAKGYPVKSVDIDRSKELADRYEVTAVPTFVVVDPRGRVLSRTSGYMPAAKLASFYNETKLSTPAPAGGEAVEERDSRANREDVPPEGAEEKASDGPAIVNPKPWETVVRIKMHLSDTEWGFGSGTIIYSSADESIILTCAHIFRVKGKAQPAPQNFRVPISVDLFDGQLVSRQPAMINCSERDIPGEAIDYDFTNDVGLIRIKPGRRLASSRVVPPDWKPRKGMKMFAVGCSHGHDATAWDTTILDPRVGMSNSATKQGFATMKCAHQPKEGRSGGGLYTTDGYVAGVCDFADPNEHVGLYAVPEAIHRLLDRNQLMALYKRGGDQPGTMLASEAGRARTRNQGGTYYRLQNTPLKESAPAADAITLPPFDMVASREARESTAKPWQRSDDPGKASRTARSTGRPDALLADSVDPGARPGEAITTDLSMEPTPEAQALDRLQNRPARRVDPDPAPAPRAAKGWMPARKALPDLNPSQRSPR